MINKKMFRLGLIGDIVLLFIDIAIMSLSIYGTIQWNYAWIVGIAFSSCQMGTLLIDLLLAINIYKRGLSE